MYATWYSSAYEKKEANELNDKLISKFLSLTVHQFMAVMCLIFIILFSVSAAALAITSSQQKTLLKKAWGSFSNVTKRDVQKWGNCCGFENRNSTDHPSCKKVLIHMQ